MAEMGTIMMQSATVTPGWTSEPYSPGWEMVQAFDPDSLDGLHKAGWKFFFLAERIESVAALISGKQAALRKAISRILRKAKATGFNSLEITEVSQRRFLGLPYLFVSAHPRHIQKGNHLAILGQRKQSAPRQRMY